MKISTLVLFSTLIFASAAFAQEVDLKNVQEANVVSPRNIAQAQRSTNNEIEYMIENYSLPELARYAVHLNKLQIKEAQASGSEVPAKLTKEILSDRQKIGEYLRSFYKFSY